MTMLQHFISEIRAMTIEELIEFAEEDMHDEPDAIIDALLYELLKRLPDDKRKVLLSEIVMH